MVTESTADAPSTSSPSAFAGRVQRFQHYQRRAAEHQRNAEALARRSALVSNLRGLSFAIAVVAFADTSVLSRVYSAKTRTYVDPNQEMIGLGVSSASAGFFGGFPVGSSSVRTALAHSSGSKSQLTSLVGALMITLLLVFGPRLLEDLPH